VISVARISPQDTHALRRDVLRHGNPGGDVAWPRDDDADTRHFGAMREGQIVAIGTVYVAPIATQARPTSEALTIPADHQWQFRGMASAVSARGGGYGAAVLEAIFAHVRAVGAGTPQLVWCNARVVAIGFYEKYAMTIVSDRFDIPTVGPHVVMQRVV
jgi:GNAT superfamily N-acetyltransferase